MKSWLDRLNLTSHMVYTKLISLYNAQTSLTQNCPLVHMLFGAYIYIYIYTHIYIYRERQRETNTHTQGHDTMVSLCLPTNLTDMLRGINEQKQACSPQEKYPLSLKKSVCYVI